MTEYSRYPNQVDTSSELPLTVDLKTYVRAEVVNRIRDAVIKIETELGIQPSSTYGNVKDRLDAIQTALTNLTVPGTRDWESVGSAGRQTHDDSSSWLALGSFYVDPSATSSDGRQIKLQAIMFTEDTVGSAQVRFWNQTHGYAVTTLTGTVAQHNPELTSSDIGVGSATAGNLPNSGSIVVVQLKKSVDGDGSSYRAICDMAKVVGEYPVET